MLTKYVWMLSAALVFSTFAVAGNLGFALAHDSAIATSRAILPEIRVLAGRLGVSALLGKGDFGPASRAIFTDPIAVAVDGTGNVFVADDTQDPQPAAVHCEVREIVRSSGRVVPIAGRGQDGVGNDLARHLTLGTCGGVGMRKSASVVFSDRYSGHVYVVSEGSGHVAVLSGHQRISTGQIAIGSRGEVYATEPGQNRVVQITAARALRPIAGNGKLGFSGDGGAARNASLDGPEAVAVGPEGNVFIADTGNHRIREVFVVSQGIRTVATRGVCGRGETAAGRGSPLLFPRSGMVSLAVNRFGRLFVAVAARGVFELTKNMQCIYRVAGSGKLPTSSQAMRRQLSAMSALDADLDPSSIAVTNAGKLVVADVATRLIRIVTLPQVDIR